MTKILGLVILLMLGGCTGLTATELLEAISFGPEEEGCARITGNLELNAGMFATTTVNILIVKSKGENVPDC